tara:strand:+ start:2416 stop:2856 length:441 start_codon:yes stop_codon:yes gene_type:complete
MNFENMVEKYPHLQAIIDQCNKLDSDSQSDEESANKLCADAKKLREQADEEAKKLELKAESNRTHNEWRNNSAEMLKSAMLVMCTALAEKDEVINELRERCEEMNGLKEKYVSTLEAIGSAKDGADDMAISALDEFTANADKDQAA